MTDATAPYSSRATRRGDFTTLMRWFLDAQAIAIWGGPDFRWPFDEASFVADCKWPELASVSLLDEAGAIVAFGQYYERAGRIHLGRLAVQPQARGRGLGRHLIRALLRRARERLPLAQTSLYVYRSNRPALACYRSLGYRSAPFPPNSPQIDDGLYLTADVGQVLGEV